MNSNEIKCIELPLDHEPSLEHWAKSIADDDISTGYHTNWDYAYEQAWHWLDAVTGDRR